MQIDQTGFSCPPRPGEITNVRLGHGSGGQLSSDLLNDLFLQHISSPHTELLEDAAIVQVAGQSVTVTTDSYVVNPIFFAGGDIGSLAVHGTVNDLAVRGAQPLFITAAFILEEGLAFQELEQVVKSFAEACRRCNVQFAAGDTKVVNKGAGDKIFITTTGIGSSICPDPPSCGSATVGDAILVSGDIGRHGTAIMCARSDLGIETSITSDSQSVFPLVQRIYKATPNVHCMRDITRGGLATVLSEIASASNVGLRIDEKDIPIDREVKGLTELLGLDPLYIACEGRIVVIVPQELSDEVLSAMRSGECGLGSCQIGSVVDDHRSAVVCTTSVGGRRYLDKLSGEQLPRIC
jgi:hydrogenase expression/formation protein HypE